MVPGSVKGKDMTLNKRNYYRGCDSRKRGCIVIGHQFGPCLYAFECDLEEAIDEFDERYGTRVDANDPDLADYGDTPDEQFEKAMSDGEIRINDGGTVVWVDHYEWMREFDSRRAALECFRH